MTTELMVCVKCRAGQDVPDGGERPGQALHDQLAGMTLPDGVVLKPVECMQNCDHGCSVTLRGGPEKWTYVYGNFDASLLDVIVEGAAKYHDASDGLIPWRERPDHLKKNCIARIPPMEAPND